MKIKGYRKIGIYPQALCEVVLSLLSDSVIRMDIVSNWEMFPLPSIIQWKAFKFAFKSI